MKKLVVLAAVLFTLSMLQPAHAYMVTFGVDSSLDLSVLNGFEFDIVGASVADVTFDVMFQSEGGAVPNAFTATFPWEIGKTTDGVFGFDNSFGSFPLIAGTIMTLSAATPFTLANFLLADVNESSGKYPYDFSVVSSAPPTAGAATYTLTAQVVPIPSAVLLFGSGLMGVVGLRRRMKK
jgi:hypothetical protein